MRRGLVLGSSGSLGIAWMLGVLAALEQERGWDVRDSDMIIGTSGGALLGSLLRAGHSVTELCQAQLDRLPTTTPDDGAPGLAFAMNTTVGRPGIPRPGPGSVRLLLRGLRHPFTSPPMATVVAALPRGRRSLRSVHDLVHRAGPARLDRLQIAAMNYHTGERAVFGRTGQPDPTPADAVTASMAAPGWFAPVTVEGQTYVDGGVCSPCNGDLAAGADLDDVYVLAPLGATELDRVSPPTVLDRTYRLWANHRTGRELEGVRARGTTTTLFAPNAADLRVIGANMMSCASRQSTLRSARRSTRSRLRAG